MAAPIVKKSEANLNKLISKEKKYSRPTQKHVLCIEKQPWPRLSKSQEELILLKLSEILKAVPNIFKSKKDTDKNEKMKIRAQLHIGISSVLRALEQDNLLCVLVSGKAAPAITVDHVIALARNRCCPLLCLDGLSTTLATALESKSLPLSVGFKKLEKEEQSDFADVISLVMKHAPSLQSNSSDKVSNAESCSPQQSPALIAKPCLPGKSCGKLRAIHINSSDEMLLLAEIKRVFSLALVEAPQPKEKTARKKKKGRKNVKEMFDKNLQHQFEAGKRTVIGAVERGRLDVILASQEVATVVMSSPLFQRQFSRWPPIIILPGLTNMLRVLTSGSCCVSFLGLKKLSHLPPSSRQDFKKTIEICFQSLKDGEGVKPVSQNCKAGLSVLKTENSKIYLKDDNGNSRDEKSKTDLHEEIKEVTKGKSEKEFEEKNDQEEEDYYYLYNFKKDSKDLFDLRTELRSEAEKAKEAKSFSSDFISLSAGEKSPTANTINITNKERNLQAIDQINAKPISLPKSLEKIKMEDPTTGAQLNSMWSTTPNFIFSDANGSVKSNNTSLPIKKSGQMAYETRNDASNSVTADSISCGTQLDKDEKEKTSETAEKKANVFPTRESDSSVIFCIDKSGDGSRKTAVSAGKKNTRTKDNAIGEEILQTPKGKGGIDYLALDVAVRNKHKAKFFKRKLMEEESFISFNYTEANIKTMVSNPSKKSKKKRKK